MTSNDQVILRKILEQKRAEIATEMPEEEYFDLFCAEQVLKDYDLDYDEIEAGLVGGGGDGGVDSVYGFVNDDAVAEDTDPTTYKRDITLELVIIQSKTNAKFQETPLDRLHAVTHDLLNLASPIEGFGAVYNASLLAVLSNFRRMVEGLATKFPKLVFRYYCISQGDASQVHPNVRRKVEAIREELSQLFSSGAFSCGFLGARELLALARREPIQTFSLPFLDNPISSRDNSYVCLVSLRDYFGFITNPDRSLRKGMLEANVRDYQGSVEVNKAIAQSLASDEVDDFWWLNNGATVIASRGSIAGKTLTLEDAKIVNGLQTSMEVLKHFSADPSRLSAEKRNILVKVIITDDEACRDLIITATNSQTAIPPASLRATDPIHRNIEDFFEANGLYYDRRKNYHKNKGRPIGRIVSIAYLAQSVASILLHEPDNSRARPSSLMKEDAHYGQVFNQAYPIEMYVACARIMKQVDDFLRRTGGDVPQEDKTNLRFYLATCAVVRTLGKVEVTAADVAGLAGAQLPDDVLAETLALLREQLAAFASGTGSDRAKAAKSKEFREHVLDLAKAQLATSPGEATEAGEA